MIPEEKRERIRRAYYLEKKSLRAISREEHCCRETVKKALGAPNPSPRVVVSPIKREGPVFQPFQHRVEELLEQNETLPRKQHYTCPKIFATLRSEGYTGCESRIRQFVGQWHRARQSPDVFLPLEFEPGQDAQVDWGEATILLKGDKQIVNLFVMRLSYSRRTFVMAFPSQKQEHFFFGHVCAFEFFGGVPSRISYDNLATAVKLAFEKGTRSRQENRSFITFRSHYLFSSHFCTPGQGHEKGGVEHGVGFVRRNYLVPLPEVDSFGELNQYLLQQCLKDDQRCLHRQRKTIGQVWQEERSALQALPPHPYECCDTQQARVTPYSQIVYETNRYSLPVDRTRRTVTVKAYPFHIDVFDGMHLLTTHPRCYAREQDIFDPLHYLPLLEQRPGAFAYAKPIKRWQEEWPASYHHMLHLLQEKWPEGRGIQEFVRILQLHQHYPSSLIEQAIEQALSYGCVHLDGVLHCLHQLLVHEEPTVSLDLSDRPDLAAVGKQPIDLSRYEQLLKRVW